MKEINVYDALKLLRRLATDNIPVRISFVSCDRTRKESQGLVVVERAILTAGLPRKKSRHAMNLIAYEDTDTKQRRHFWLPLLMTVNDLKITHDRISK